MYIKVDMINHGVYCSKNEIFVCFSTLLLSKTETNGIFEQILGVILDINERDLYHFFILGEILM